MPFLDYQLLTDEEIELIYERTLREMDEETELDLVIPASDTETTEPTWFWMTEPVKE